MGKTQRTSGSSNGLSDSAPTGLKAAQSKQLLNALRSDISSMRTQQEDTILQGRYGDYDPRKVNQLQEDLITGKYRAGREDIWKVMNYENAIRKAYEYGKQDRQLDMNEKAGALSPDGVNATPASTPPERAKNESGPQYFKRIALQRMQEIRGKR